MFMVSGTIKSAVNLAQMDQKWQQKKARPTKQERNRELTVQERQLQQYKEDMERMREQSRQTEISNKLKAGYTLTNEEITYLRRNNPEALKEYEEVKRERAAYEKQLKNCKSKEETEKLKLTKMGSFLAETKAISNDPYIPKSKKIELLEKLQKKAAGVQAVHQDFTETLRYQQLPESEDERRQTVEEDTLAKESVDGQKTSGTDVQVHDLDEVASLQKQVEDFITDKSADDRQTLQSKVTVYTAAADSAMSGVGGNVDITVS
ncbi:MAG: hypothetical protein K2I21_09390 [Acetatifactor sp.]|nr:hypothetical protein [Acetatifactor sp.]